MAELQVGFFVRESAAEPQPQLPRLGELVRGEDGRGLYWAAGHLAAKGGLARPLVLDRRVVADRPHERADLGAEAFLQLGLVGVCVLEYVMQNPGGDGAVGIAGEAEERADLQRMKDERRLVALAPLARVAFQRELQRRP